MKLLSLLAVATHAVAQAMTSQGTTVRLDSTDYFISPVAKGAVPRSAINPGSLRHAMGFAPVTVVAGAVSPETLGSLFANWTTTDDVWSPGFLGGLVLRAASDNAGQHGKFEASYHNGTRSTVFSIREEPGVPSGPYFVNVYSGQLHEAYRLYDDFSGSFTESLLQLPDGTFQPLGGRSQSSGTLTIGVPSRLYSVGAADKPLAGVRIGVKDLYDLAGVRSSRGNRAWYGLYPPANQTAPAIQNLIDAGAVIVGYQKLSQFANGAGTTGDWVDYHAPFNPRGDGYQVPSSSSSGAGASVASYPWLDLAVGSDTGGSVRGPAGVNGLFGNRPTHGLVSLDHVMPLSPALDTAGLLARDPRIWAAAQKAMYRDNFTALAPGSAKYPGTIYTLGFPELHTLRGSVLHKFSRDLAALLGATVTQYDLDAHWHKSAPETVSSVPLSDLLNLTYSALITKQQIPLVREPFYKDYADVHDGRVPFIDPAPRIRWAWADSVPDSILDDALRNKTVFMDWFNHHVLPPVQDSSQCSSRILLHDDSTGSFERRDTYGDTPGVPFGWSYSEMSVFSGAPDSVFPLGELSAPSEVTGHNESLPVTVDVMAARGCDGLIASLAQHLTEAGILHIPQAGASVVTGSAVLL